jgi:tRNA(adenine34) deaminase
MNDLDYLKLALDEAIAAGQAGEVPVGAVMVREDAVLVRAQNRVLRDNDPTAHAEVVALRAAGQALGNHRLNGCTMFTLLPIPRPGLLGQCFR